MDELHHEWRGNALYGNRNDENVNVNQNDANNHNHNRAFRGSIRVYWLCEDLSQPPSILPISCVWACSWKTRVSFTSFNSSKRRSFRVRTSKPLLALSKYALFIVFGAFFAITRCSKTKRMLFSILLPRLKRHRFIRWSFTSVNCLYNS